MPTPEDIQLRAKDCLEEQFANNYEPEKQVKKYLPGVIRAINKIPEGVWKSHWFVEREVSGVFEGVEMGLVALNMCNCETWKKLYSVEAVTKTGWP